MDQAVYMPAASELQEQSANQPESFDLLPSSLPLLLRQDSTIAEKEK
jgi:hypothetical protein